MSTRRGTLLAALLIALLAGASILLYLNSYRDSLKAQGALVTVLVAKKSIPKGTAGNVVAAKDLYTATTIRESQLLDGASAIRRSLRDKVAAREIFEGAQLTATDFGAAGDSLAAQLTDKERVISVPLDSAHGLIDGIEAGNRRRLRGLQRDSARRRRPTRQRGPGAPDAAADPLGRPGAGRRREGQWSTNVSLGVDDVEAAQVAFASDNGKLWLALRPSAGAKTSRARRRHGRDHAPRRPAGADPEVGRGPSVNTRGFHVYAALEGSLGLDAIREALPAGTPLRTVSLAEAGRPGSEIQHGADLVIVGCSRAHDQALAVISAASAQRSDRPVVVLYHGSPNGFLEQAFEAGADDLVALPQSAGQLGFALEKALARRRGAVASAAEGSMITVLGPKGGTGKTVTSSNLAVALANEDRTSVLVDLDLQFGDIGLALGLQPTKTIYDLAVSGGTLDGDKIDSFLAQHSSGARALLAPLRPDQAAAIGTAFLREVFEILRSRYDFVLVDTPPAFTPEVIAAVDASSHLCMVGMLEAPR